MKYQLQSFFFFFFNDTATTEIYTLSLHDALPISSRSWMMAVMRSAWRRISATGACISDRKSTRLNSSHLVISYAVFCLKKKKTKNLPSRRYCDSRKLVRHLPTSTGCTFTPYWSQV